VLDIRLPGQSGGTLVAFSQISIYTTKSGGTGMGLSIRDRTRRRSGYASHEPDSRGVAQGVGATCRWSSVEVASDIAATRKRSRKSACFHENGYPPFESTPTYDKILRELADLANVTTI
jgi:hypothetical protein